ALEDRFGEELAARNLDAELALQPEDDIQEVDRLGAEVRLEPGLRGNLFFIDVQRIHEDGGHLPLDLFLTLHGTHLRYSRPPAFPWAGPGGAVGRLRLPLVAARPVRGR